MDFRITNVLDVMSGALFALASTIFVVIFQMGFQGVFLAYSISVLFATVLSFVAFVRKYRPQAALNGSFAAFSYHYGFRCYLGTLAKRGNTSLDQFFLGILAPAQALGNYSVALSLANFLYFLPQSIAPVLVNQVAALRDDRDPEKIGVIHRSLILTQLVAGLCVAIGGFIVMPYLLPQFEDLPFLILLLVPGAVFYSAYRILESYFAGIGKPGRTSSCHVAAAFASLISYPLLIPTLGGYGAAIALSLNYAGMHLIIAWMYSRSIAPHPAKLFQFSTSDLVWIRDHAAVLLRRFRNRTNPESVRTVN